MNRLRRDRKRFERREQARLRLGVERQNAALLDQRARERLDEHALRQLELDRRARTLVAGLVARGQRQRDLGAGPRMIREILGGLPGAVAGARLRQHQREIRRAVERARHAPVGPGLLLQREIRLRADHAVIVLDLVGELQRAARLRLRLLGERDGRRAIRDGGEREGDVLVEHAAQGRGAAIRDGVAVLFGAGGRRRRAFAARLGKPAARHDFEPACAARADHQHAARRHGLDQRGLMRLAGADAGQDHRRLAGIGRRRHPGIDAEILRLHHAGPVERRGDAFHALAGRREERGARRAARPARAPRSDRTAAGAGAASRPSARSPRAAPARHARATARANTWSCSPAASSSASAVAGRCFRPLPRSRRRSPSNVLGRRKRNSGTAATAISTTRTNSAIARPSGGSHSHRPGP